VSDPAMPPLLPGQRRSRRGGRPQRQEARRVRR
jgi:hypothetical protein